MRDIYIDRSEFELKYNPKKSKGLLEFKNPELILNSKTKYHKFPDNYVNEENSREIPIVCKSLITNRDHDGIWLTIEHDKHKVSIPGGKLGETELNYLKSDEPYLAIYNTIIREMIEENPFIRYDYFPAENGAYDTLRMVVEKYGFTMTHTMFPLYYCYYIKEYSPVFIVFIIIEVDEPNTQIAPLSNFTSDNMVWYTRKDHSVNMKAKHNRKELFCSPYDNDTRTGGRGLSILDVIFNTDKIFGKLDIY